ncbi:glycosyltransferase family 4 protein [Halomontanus rarus]|uniref:glycosyltransferase family 4 protein n=1 Tax=Halomontanus rarus TaxID=3034020 RepID=UPI0023E8E9BA|nr:glycosyltransferase family 4 protein [Halovivax sp. TS33]
MIPRRKETGPLRVLNTLTDPRVGGPQIRSLAVARALDEYDIETVFLVPDGSDEFEEMATDAGFEVLRPDLPRIMPPTDIVGNSRYAIDFYPAVRRLRSLLETHEIDIVHASTTLNFRAVIAATQASVPVAWFFNDTGTPWPINRFSARMARSMADEIAVAADAVHDHFFTESVSTRTVYPPVDTSVFDPETIEDSDRTAREEFGIPDDVPIVGTIGNVNPIKGHEYFLRAVARVEEQFGPVAVPVVGSILESRREYFERLKRLRSRLGLDETVRFIGHRSDVSRLLDSFDVFVLASVKEACPIAVLEAMAMRTPVVTTRVGGTPEQIVDGEHGWIVPPRDPDALADAISDALTAPDERQRRGRAARKRVAAEFSLERCTERHLAMYESALESP